jgi:hypothetical protein
MDSTAQNLMSRLRQRPLDAAILEALRQHCETVTDPATWAEALEHHARAAEDAAADPVALGRLHFELGNLYRDHLRRLDRAIQHYRSAADCDPAQRPAMAAARGLFAEAGNWEQVTKLLALEAESLPRGGKRAQLLTELADVYRARLESLPQALGALREAVASAPAELMVRHQLATLLLELADREPEETRAEEKRVEAADTLAEMARQVSDDYAFAYAEAALDAAPNHPGALGVLESVAPRIGREDAVATRWVAALQRAPSAPGAREIRLKLARAYELAGQIDDARICLEPIATSDDPEARVMLAGLGRSSGHRELTLFEADDPFPEGARSLADELAALTADDSQESRTGTPNGGLGAQPAQDTDVGAPPDGARSVSARHDETRVDAPLPDDATPSVGVRVLEDEPTRMADLAARALAGLMDEQAPPAEGATSALGEVSDEHALNELSDADLHEAPISEELPAQGSGATASAPLFAAPPQEADEDEEAAEVDDDEITREPTAPRGAVQATASRPVTISVPVSAPEPSQPVDPLTALQDDLERRLKFRDRRGAADVAERIIGMGVLDAGAIAALEDHYRTTRDFRRMRDLAMRIAGESSVPEDDRVSRLREAAMLCESKLGDVEGTTRALVGLLALRPLDDEAFGKLKRMFLRLGRFDDLARLLSQTADALPERKDQAARLRELYVLHRDKRRSPAEAIEVLELLRQRDPGHADDDTALYELYRGAGRHADAALVLRGRIDATEEPVERVPLLGELAELLETQLHDADAAYETNTELLQIAPRHPESLERAARIETALQRYDLLVETLQKKLESIEGAARLPLLLRVADVTIAELGKPSAAADALAEALALAPQDRELWHKAALGVVERERAADFDTRLEEVLAHSRDAALRFDLGAILAERRERADDLAGAISVREAQLALRRDEPVLRSLVGLLRRADRTSDLARRLDDLARMVPADQARDLRLERATLLVERLQNPEAAKNELERILAEVAPDDPAVLSELVELSRRTEDVPRRVRAQERLLHVTRELEQRIELAEDLVDVYERVLADTESALRVLRTWCEFDRSNPRPRIRLLPLLEGRGERQELVGTLDALAALAIADDETGEYVQRAARVAMDLGDYDGAWNRLVPRVVDASDNGAELLLTQLALRAQRGEQLATLYVGLAQRATEADVQQARWTSAARVFDTMVGDPARALEAALRAFAKDLDDPTMLTEVERLAEASKADKRLEQVYDSLVRRATTPQKRAQLLLRHAKLLEERFGSPGQALKRAALAFQVEPADKQAYAESIRLSERADDPAERLRLHELRAETTREPAERVRALLAGCAVALTAMADKAGAVNALKRAVRTARVDETLLERIESEIAQLRVPGVAAGEPPLARALAAAYASHAAELRERGDVAALLTRAAAVVDREASDPSQAFDYLLLATRATPENADLLDRVGVLAERCQRRSELADHLSELAHDAIDSATAVESLRRLAALYEGPLDNPERAAATYEEEVKLRPHDKDAHARLRNCLSRAERHKDLLEAIDRELALEQPPEERAALWVQTAETWERALGNRFEARDAYRKALALVPDDTAIAAAIERVSARTAVDDADLLDGDLVVRPEDLRPSMPIELEPAPTPAADVIDALGSRDADDPDAEAPAAVAAAAEETDDAGVTAAAGQAEDEPASEALADSEEHARTDEPAQARTELSEPSAVDRPEPDYDEARTGQFVPRNLLLAARVEAPAEEQTADASETEDAADASHEAAEPSTGEHAADGAVAAPYAANLDTGAYEAAEPAHGDDAPRDAGDLVSEGPNLEASQESLEKRSAEALADPSAGVVEAVDGTEDVAEQAQLADPDEPTSGSGPAESEAAPESHTPELAEAADEAPSIAGGELALSDEGAPQSDEAAAQAGDVAAQAELALGESAQAAHLGNVPESEQVDLDAALAADGEELEELDGELEELEESALDSGPPAAAPVDDEGLDALSGLVASAPATPSNGRKVPPPPPRLGGTAPPSLAPRPPTLVPDAPRAKTAPPPPPRRP